jgi:outer membrane scaffolding protein for murein synthesis (MipA/OmpV family)
MPSPFIRRTVLVLLFATLPLPGAAQAPVPDEPPAPAATAKPLWEAGLVAGAGRVSDYPGAGQSHVRGLIAPFVVYRGRVLNIDGEGIRGRIVDHPDFDLQLTASGAFNARDNDARQGMPQLDYLFGLGPQLVYKGLRRVPGAPTLHLKARALFSTDFRHIDGRGASFEPELRWRFERWGGTPASLLLGLQPTWGSRGMMRYFYEVTPDQAMAGRPAYAARAGYLGTELKATVSHRISGSLSWFVAVRALSLHGAANEDSPLLQRSGQIDLGAGLVWTPWKSSRPGQD